MKKPTNGEMNESEQRKAVRRQKFVPFPIRCSVLGYGNYTKERETLFGEMSLDDITAEIKRTREAIAPADSS